MNLYKSLTAVLLCLFLASCGEKAEQYVLRTGTIVLVKHVDSHRIEVLNHNDLSFEEVVELYALVSRGCFIRREQVLGEGLFSFLSEKTVLKHDCTPQGLQYPITHGDKS